MVRTSQHGHQTYVLIDLAEEDYEEYYNGYANRVLWPILHYRLDFAEFSRRDLSGYMRVNQRFAAELHKVLQSDDVELTSSGLRIVSPGPRAGKMSTFRR